jgi:hypothetical protein
MIDCSPGQRLKKNIIVSEAQIVNRFGGGIAFAFAGMRQAKPI